MHFLTQIRRKLITLPLSKWAVRKSKKLTLPGFYGISLFEVVVFFWKNARKNGFTERASAVAFNFTMAIPPIIIFLFTLIPLFPISDQLVNQLYDLIKNIIPGENNNKGILSFLDFLLTKPQTKILSTSAVLAMFFSSNAMMGIMRSFDKKYIGFKKRSGIRTRIVAICITLIIFVLLMLSLIAIILQKKVLIWLGLNNATALNTIETLRWIFIALMAFFSISFIYRFAPSVQKKWKLINPGSIFATFLLIAFVKIFSYWVSNFSKHNELYGSISAVLIIMLMIYFTSLMLLIGFELNVSINTIKHQREQPKGLITLDFTT